MANVAKLEDPVWEYVLYTKLLPYIPAVRKFWKNIEGISVYGTGVYDIIDDEEVPPGLKYRVTSTPVRSPIKNVQIFPFVPTAYLQIQNCPGGATKMVQRICTNNAFTIEEFSIIEKSNLPSTYHNGQFLAFVPKDIIEGITELGKWVYMTKPEMFSLASNIVPPSILLKVTKYL